MSLRLRLRMNPLDIIGISKVLKKGQKKSPTKAGLYEGFGNDILSQVLPKYHLRWWA